MEIKRFHDGKNITYLSYQSEMTRCRGDRDKTHVVKECKQEQQQQQQEEEQEEQEQEQKQQQQQQQLAVHLAEDPSTIGSVGHGCSLSCFPTSYILFCRARSGRHPGL